VEAAAKVLAGERNERSTSAVKVRERFFGPERLALRMTRLNVGARSSGVDAATKGRELDDDQDDSFAVQLLLEEIFEGLAGVVGTGRARGGWCLRRVGDWRGVFLDGHPKLEERAIISRVLLGDTLGNRLGAFELRGGIEMDALFATVQLEMAAWTLPVGIEPGHQNGTATRASRPHHCANHARSARAHLFLFGTRLARAFLLFLGAIVFLIALLLILPLHTDLRGVDPSYLETVSATV
jgi:hypothetical protein